MKRDRLTDLLKGYACLLVVFGHVIIGLRTSGAAVPSAMPLLEKFIWTYHIDLFMFLSGYVYSITGGWQRKGTRLRFIGCKLLDLGIPYFVFSSLYIAVNHFTPGVNNPSALSDILKLPYRPVAQYWFLFALFWLFVIWTLLSKFFPNYIITVLTFAVFIICKVLQVDLLFLDSSFNCALAFGLGTSLKSLDIKKLPAVIRALVIPVHIAAACCVIYYDIYEKLFVDDALTLLGIFSSVCFISLLGDIKPVPNFLQLICRDSFPIYLLHTFFTAAVRILLLKLGVANYTVHVIAGMAAGLIFPIAAARLCSLSPFLDILFYPSRSIKKIRSHNKD